MKRILVIALMTILFCYHHGYSQEIPEGAIRIDDNTIIKDDSGNKIEMFELMDLLNSGEWKMDPVTDEKGDLLYMQLRKATEEEKSMMKQMQPSMENSSELIGKSSPDFTMVDLNGNTISSVNAKGKVVVLNFWFTACKPCISEIPDLNEVYEKYKNDTNVVFASITFDKLDKVNSFLKKYPLEYPVVSNAKEVCDLFKITGFPTNIIIDKEGNYSDYITGGNPKIGQQISISIQDAIEGNKHNSSKEIMIDPNSTFKLENGEIIPFEKAIDLLNGKDYEIFPSKDEDGKEFFLVKKIKR